MKEEIKRSVLDIFEGADERNWTRVKNAMAETVLLDYSSMTGTEPAMLSPDDITNAWANFLPGFDRTKHNLTNFKISTSDKLTTITFDGKADHFINDKVWTVEGDYYAEAQSDNRISLLKFNFKTQSGDMGLPEKATEKMQNENSNNSNG
ncbi:MAG TPA: nuclear transport factor 2 family protein [Flavobacterium sp.]